MACKHGGKTWFDAKVGYDRCSTCGQKSEPKWSTWKPKDKVLKVKQVAKLIVKVTEEKPKPKRGRPKKKETTRRRREVRRLTAKKKASG